MFNKAKIRKVKTVDDVMDAYGELAYKLPQLINEVDIPFEQACTLCRMGLLGVYELIRRYSHLEHDFEIQRKLNELSFRHELIAYEDYVLRNIEIDKDEAITINKQKPIGINVNPDEWIVDPYVQSNIDYQYNKAKLELSFRMSKTNFYEYELQMADLNNDPYAKVVFEPDYENNTKTLNVNARFNEYFTDDLKKRDEFTPKFDDDGRLLKDDLVEQWFSTAIIVMAANMLKETDLDIFRSVTNDNPGVPIIEELQFDDGALDQFNEIEKEQLQELEKNGRIYR